MSVAINGDLAVVRFSRFDLNAYNLFLKAKALPESQVAYDWQSDTYELTTPARFARQLGIVGAPEAKPPLPVSDHLFDYQHWALEMALEARRFALWLDTGLGKTAVYLEWARQVHAMTGGRVLILAPLPVIVSQIRAEWERFYGRRTPMVWIRNREDLDAWLRGGGGDDPSAGSGWLGITNYEKFIPGTMSELRRLAGLVADESSILRTGGGTIKWNLIKSARGIEYKLSCTATPAPNEAMEYASQAAFLEKLRTEGDILWTYFQRDKRGEWTVKDHAKPAFYRFMTSWSLYLRDPARFGFRDILADLPEPEYVTYQLPMTAQQKAMLSETLAINGVGLWADDRVSVTVRSKLLQIARGFRYQGTGSLRAVERVKSHKPEYVWSMADGDAQDGRQVLIWTTFDEEGEIIHEHFKHAPFEVAVIHGRNSVEERAAILDRFRAGEIRVLISKPQLVGYGLNLQFVQTMIFSGFDDSFERRYQAIRRAYRFGQSERVRIITPYIPELEGMVFENLAGKERRFLEDVAAQEEQYRIALGMEAVG